MKISLPKLREFKHAGHKFACLTAYDSSIAAAASAAGVEVLLVGDSLGNVVQGQSSTLGVRLRELSYHTRCVGSTSGNSLLMADAPLLSTASLEVAVRSARALLRAGAQCVKYECSAAALPVIRALVELEVPVCVHLGLKPQSLPKLGAYKAQALDAAAATELLNLAQNFDQLGVDCLLLECVGAEAAAQVAQKVRAPVIGIGSGADVDGQILVCYDALGMNAQPARFVEDFLDGQSSVQAAFANYAQQVRAGTYPRPEHCY